jgi:DNA-binding XRE family transcriptional regulator
MTYSYNEYAKNEYPSQQEILSIHKKVKVDLIAIGSRIRKLRADIHQEDLAAYLHVSQGHLSKIERGKIAPSIEILILISDKFRKSVDWILRGEGS